MGRTLKGVFATLLVALLPFLLVLALIVVIVKTQPDMLHGRLITALTTAFIMCVVTAALALPLMHVLMKYIMEPPCSFWKTLRKHYSSGMRHWGMLFLVFFVSTLTVQLVQLVVMLPAHILNIASQTAYLGLLKGDPLGMPSYINTLTFVTFTLLLLHCILCKSGDACTQLLRLRSHRSQGTGAKGTGNKHLTPYYR